MLSVKQWLDLRDERRLNHDAAPKSVAESLWVLPCRSVASADWTRAFLSVRDDGCDRGIFFIHDEAVTEPRAIIGWKQGADRRFVLCTLRHCTPLEDGFYRVGMLVDEVIRLEPEDVETMRRVLEERSVVGIRIYPVSPK
jgi:hypothetical protein